MEKCVLCGKNDDDLVNYLCDDCWDESLIDNSTGIPLLDDDAINKKRSGKE